MWRTLLPIRCGLDAGRGACLGQLNPLTALKLTDEVNRVSKLRRLEPGKAGKVYEAIMDPDITLAYMAASLDNAIDQYCKIANFDISKNPGVTATLYNLGNVTVRASKLKRRNARRRAAGQSLILPSENYYGWLINDKLKDLKSLL